MVQETEKEREGAKRACDEAETQGTKEEARRTRICQATAKRESAEAAHLKSKEVTSEALQMEHYKAEELAFKEDNIKVTEVAVQQARRAFEEAMWILNECRVRLVEAHQAADDATISSAQALAEWRAATSAREAAEAEESRLQQEREQAEHEEVAALSEDIDLGEQDDEAHRREEVAESIRKLAELRAQEEVYESEWEAKKWEAKEQRRKAAELEE